MLLRDSNGNLEIVYLGPTGVSGTADLTPAQLKFSATASFTSNNPGLPLSGEFDSSWKVADVGAINGYAGIIWTNALSEVGITQFIYPTGKPYGNVIATLPAGTQIRGLGDYNGDGSIDLLLRAADTGLVSFWYMGFMGGNYYQPAPATGIGVPASWQN